MLKDALKILEKFVAHEILHPGTHSNVVHGVSLDMHSGSMEAVMTDCFRCKINGEIVIGCTSCEDCDGYEMCTADKESEIWRFRVN